MLNKNSTSMKIVEDYPKSQRSQKSTEKNTYKPFTANLVQPAKNGVRPRVNLEKIALMKL